MAGATPATRRVLQAMFGMSTEDLLRPWAPDLVSVTPAIDDGSLVLPSPGNERSMIAMAAERARRFTLMTSESTTPEAVEQLRDDVQRLALAYPQRPLTELLGDLVETQDTLFAILERRQAPNQARQLHFLASVTCGLLAKASHDLADPHAAMLQARTAVLCADQADHDGLRAWLRGLQSLVATGLVVTPKRCATPRWVPSSPAVPAAPLPSGCPSALLVATPRSATVSAQWPRSVPPKWHGSGWSRTRSTNWAASARSTSHEPFTTRPTHSPGCPPRPTTPSLTRPER
jgi:hypothetical protein